MKFYINGRPVTKANFALTLYRAAFRKGYDPEEAIDILNRALEDTFDGECARDELFHYHDGLEIFLEED